LYDSKLKSHFSPEIPSICVGNLSVGGTGKTPLVKYLVELLRPDYSIAILSRGYGRKTKGYLLLNDTHTANEVGDEPMEYYARFENVQVAVSEKRVEGYHLLQSENKKTEVLLLDDAFQHRAFSAGMNILVTAYNNLYTDDFLLPSGRLRESREGAKRAQIIVVSKCPKTLTEKERAAIALKLKLQAQQYLFFTTLVYGAIYSFHTNEKVNMEDMKQMDVSLFSGIGNDQPIIDYLQNKVKSLWVKKYTDHYVYTNDDIAGFYQRYSHQPNSIFITTEKDAARLRVLHNNLDLLQLALYILPVNVIFTTEKERDQFNTIILNYVRENKFNG
jgi:tetraacyldisaccharide 4'-kinase